MRIPRALPAFLIVAAGLGVFGSRGAFAAGPAHGAAGTAESVEQPTNDGSWDGTWSYVYRDGRMVMWMRTREDGTPEAKVRFQSTTGPEEFETDWSGEATYVLGGQPATFHLEIVHGDANRIEGNWLWDVQFPSAGRSERGAFTMFRTFDGRELVLRFTKYEKVVRKGGHEVHFDAPVSWSFRKVSRRQALWDEVY